MTTTSKSKILPEIPKSCFGLISLLMRFSKEVGGIRARPDPPKMMPAPMNFDEFENLARLYVVGALEDGEEDAFLEARREFGDRAEKTIAEFRQLNSVFALSLRPHPPHPDTKRKLLKAIRQSMHEPRNLNGDCQDGHDAPRPAGEVGEDR
jgi:hypothetical protein